MVPRLTPEQLSEINSQLRDYYSNTEDKSNFRIVWADDELEHRFCSHSTEGFQLLHPEIRQVRKYVHYIQERYILERLTVVPAMRDNDLVQTLSYEPLWTWENSQGATLPTWKATRFVIEHVLKAVKAQGMFVKYEDPNANPEESKEAHLVEVNALITELFGNESEVGDALAYHEAITVPSNYNRTVQE